MALDRKQTESRWRTSTGLGSLAVERNQPPHTPQISLPHYACALKLCAFNLWAKSKPFFVKFPFQRFYPSNEKNNSSTTDHMNITWHLQPQSLEKPRRGSNLHSKNVNQIKFLELGYKVIGSVTEKGVAAKGNGEAQQSGWGNKDPNPGYRQCGSRPNSRIQWSVPELGPRPHSTRELGQMSSRLLETRVRSWGDELRSQKKPGTNQWAPGSVWEPGSKKQWRATKEDTQHRLLASTCMLRNTHTFKHFSQ